jgi:hypothetical protein
MEYYPMNDNIGVGPGLVLFTHRVVSAVGRLDIDLDMLFIIYMIFTLSTPDTSHLTSGLLEQKSNIIFNNDWLPVPSPSLLG